VVRLYRLYPSSPVAQFVRERIPALRSSPLNQALASTDADERAKIAWALNRLRELLEPI
jgi:hypothetical protein